LGVGWERETSLEWNFSTWVNGVFDSIGVSLVIGDLDGNKDADIFSTLDISIREGIECFEPSGLVVSKGKVFDDSRVSNGNDETGHPPSSIWNGTFKGFKLEGNFPVQLVSDSQNSNLDIIDV
jgi:hypothetical protein